MPFHLCVYCCCFVCCCWCRGDEVARGPLSAMGSSSTIAFSAVCAPSFSRSSFKNKTFSISLLIAPRFLLWVRSLIKFDCACGCVTALAEGGGVESSSLDADASCIGEVEEVRMRHAHQLSVHFSAQVSVRGARRMREGEQCSRRSRCACGW